MSRLKRVEWENRVLKWAGATLLALVIVFALYNTTQQPVLVYVDERYIDCEGAPESTWKKIGIHAQRERSL